MILITSSGEFSFFSFFSILLSVFFFSFISLQKKKKKKKRSRIVSLLSCACPVLATGVQFLVGLDCDQMEHPYEEQHSQYPMERNPNAYRSMRDYRNPSWVSAPSYMVPQTNAPYGNSYKPSSGNHLNFSWGPEPIQYAPLTHPQYVSSSQPQPPQSTSPVEQAILNLTKLVGDFVGEQKTFNAQLSQRIHTMESSLNHKLDVLQSDLDQKLTSCNIPFQGSPISMFIKRKRV